MSPKEKLIEVALRPEAITRKAARWLSTVPAASNAIKLVPVWTFAIHVVGPQGTAKEEVEEDLDHLMRSFATEWYRDNPLGTEGRSRGRVFW